MEFSVPTGCYEFSVSTGADLKKIKKFAVRLSGPYFYF